MRYGRCDEQLSVPYQPFVEALGEPLFARGEPSRAPDTERRALFMAVSEHLARAERPLLLVLDDLQWADPGTLALVRHLIRSGTPRTLLLVLYRDGALDRLWAEARPECLSMGGLDEAAVAALLGSGIRPSPRRCWPRPTAILSSSVSCWRTWASRATSRRPTRCAT